MPIDPATLANLANQYTKNMTSIRGRRVQRLLKREFAGADNVLLAEVDSGTPAVVGMSASGAAICATDVKGQQASVIKWAHGSTTALEMQFDLHKDSLPVLGTTTLPLAQLRGQMRIRMDMAAAPSQARSLVSELLKVLA